MHTRLLTVAFAVIFFPCMAQSSGIPFGAQFQVNTFTSGSQQHASVASDSNGNFIVVWGTRDTEGFPVSFYNIHGQRYNSLGFALNEEFRINTHTTGSQEAPSVATDSFGNFVVVWWSRVLEPLGFPSSYSIQGRRFNSEGIGMGKEFQASTYSTVRQGIPRVATGPFGDFVVVWSNAQRQLVLCSDDNYFCAFSA